MNCGDIVRLAAPYITGELEAELCAEFDAHLKACGACMGEVERQARLAAEVEFAPTVTQPSLRRAVKVGAGIAAALLFLALGYRTLLVARVAPVYRAAARDHQIEIIEQQPRQWLSDAEEIASLGQRRGVSRAATSALASGGYRLLRASSVFWIAASFSTSFSLLVAGNCQSIWASAIAARLGDLHGKSRMANRFAQPKWTANTSLRSKPIASSFWW